MATPWLSLSRLLGKERPRIRRRPGLGNRKRVSLTYREAMERARDQSYRFVTQGITPGSILSINLPRSIDFVTTVLACWQRGCAYLPLDPAWPELRRQAILAEAMPAAVIEQDDSGLASVASEPYESAPISLTPETLAYVIYTSGSTGRPKGVAVTHRGLVSLFAAQFAAFDLRPGDRSLWP